MGLGTTSGKVTAYEVPARVDVFSRKFSPGDEAEIEYLREMTRAGTYEFGTEVCGLGRTDAMVCDPERPTLHSNALAQDTRIMAEFLDAPRGSTPNRMIMASRSTTKTTTMQVSEARAAILDRNQAGAYGGATKPIIYERMGFIRDILSGADHRSKVPRAWGELLPTNSGQRVEGTVSRETSFKIAGWTQSTGYPTLRAFAPDAKITGWHGRRMTLDDWVSEEAADSEIVREKAIRAYQMSVPLLLAGGILNYGCTPYHLDDLSMRILNGQEGNWEVLFLPAYEFLEEDRDLPPWERRLDFSNPRFPWNLPQWVLDIKRAGGEELFASQYLLNPTLQRDRIFPEQWYKCWTPEELEDAFKGEDGTWPRFAVWDPAYTAKKSSNHNGVIYWAYSPKTKKCYQLDWIFKKADFGGETFASLQNEVLDKCLANRVNRLYIEHTTGGSYVAIKEQFERLMADRCQFKVVVDKVLDNRENKTLRARATTPRYMAGGYRFHPACEEQRKQMIEFPNSRFDELVDCTAYVEHVLPIFSSGGSAVDITPAHTLESAGGYRFGQMLPKQFRETPPWQDERPRRTIGHGQTRGGRLVDPDRNLLDSQLYRKLTSRMGR